jgi:branched-chain amino acid transport system permease protein
MTVPIYILSLGIIILIWIILSLSLNIVTGYVGQPNIGQAAFMGIGAYTHAILMTRFDFSFWVALLIACLSAGFVGLLLGLISLRLKEDYLAFTTIGINFIVVGVFNYFDFFGGSFGIGGIGLPSILGVTLTKPYFLLMLIGIVIICIMISNVCEKSWAGLAFKTLRDDEIVAETLGINVYKFKVLAFIISTGMAGLAGGIYASYAGFIMPNDFGFIVSVTILAMLTVGGIATIRGAIFGAVILGIVPEIFRPLLEYRMILYGVIIVLIMRFLPSGLLGHGSPLIKWLGRFRYE